MRRPQGILKKSHRILKIKSLRMSRIGNAVLRRVSDRQQYIWLYIVGQVKFLCDSLIVERTHPNTAEPERCRRQHHVSGDY